MQTCAGVGRIDEGAQLFAVDELFTLIGRQRDWRLIKRFAGYHVIAARQLFAEAPQVQS